MATYYINQTGSGSANGTSLSNAWSAADFNTAGNWASTPTAGKISPGDTVSLNGTFTSGIIVRGGGTSDSARITILFADDAKFSAPAFNGIVIDVGQRSYITIDGGTDGMIENTDNGTPGSYGNTVNTTGVRIQQAVGVHVTRLTIRNLYRRTSTTDANYSAGSSAIQQIPNNAIYALSGTRISHCTFHDMSVGTTFALGSTSGDIEVHDCTIYNVDDGVVLAPGWADTTLDGAKVYRNRIYGFSKWDDTTGTNQWHHDGVHVFATASGSSYHNVHVFDNTIGPDYGTQSTSGIYMSGNLGSGNRIYQNIIFSETGDNAGNGQITARPFPGSGTLRIYNNVSLGGGQGVGIFITGQDSGAAREVVLANNIAVGITAVAVYYYERITLSSNRNLLHGAPDSFPGAYVYAIGGSASAQTISQWQGLGFDANSVYADPLLTETYRLGEGSPAIGAGENLSAFFTTDAAGNARPASGSWDIGAYAYTAASVTQFGVTFTFSADRTTGQFADGSYWVHGPVTINSITPDFSDDNNGWEVNPSPANWGHAFAKTNAHYDASYVPALPYTANTDCSIVKSISGTTPGNFSLVKTAVVLTVLMDIPAGNGAGFFRPPYVGTAKPLYATSSLRTELLPSYAPVGTPPTLASIVAKFSECLRMDHHHAYARQCRPWDTLHDYQPSNVAHIVEAMLRLMLNDPLEDKMPALIQFTQPCIDRLYAHMLGQGQGWSGHDPGHRPMAGWAAVMLNITEGLTSLASVDGPVHQEDNYLVIGGDRALWGNVYSAEWQYWNFLVNGSGGSSPQDPYGVIDGGILATGPHSGGAGDSYQVIMSQPWKGEVLVSTLMPSLQASWKTGFFPWLQGYADRWVTHGVWASPDHAAPFDAGGTRGVDYGEDPGDPGQPILGSGRFPAMHGLNADGGQNRSTFVADMWNAYRNAAPPAAGNRGRKNKGARLQVML